MFSGLQEAKRRRSGKNIIVPATDYPFSMESPKVRRFDFALSRRSLQLA
jgi:hypothetical protein